jgi:site-specific DNA recombinase
LGVDLAKGYLDRLLKNPFYVGQFAWEGPLHSGTHTHLVSVECFDRVQTVFRGHNKPKISHRNFAYRGLLTCAYDNCKVTAELKKEEYTYYHCTGFRGKCDLPYIPEERLGERLGQILKDIHIPDSVLAQLQKSLLNNRTHEEGARREQAERLAQRLAQVNRRMDQAYQDKLDGKIGEDFWERKSSEWQIEERQIKSVIHALGTPRPDRLLDAAKILELANEAYFLYVRRDHTERAGLLNLVLSNCSIDTVSVYPTYRKPL